MTYDEASRDFNERFDETRLEIEGTPDGARVRIAGWLGLEEAGRLQALMDTIMDSVEPGGTISLDLGEVRYISSTGVGLLSHALIKARGKGLRFVLSRVSDTAERVLRLLGLLSFFPAEE